MPLNQLGTALEKARERRAIDSHLGKSCGRCRAAGVARWALHSQEGRAPYCLKRWVAPVRSPARASLVRRRHFRRRTACRQERKARADPSRRSQLRGRFSAGQTLLGMKHLLHSRGLFRRTIVPQGRDIRLRRRGVGRGYASGWAAGYRLLGEELRDGRFILGLGHPGSPAGRGRHDFAHEVLRKGFRHFIEMPVGPASPSPVSATALHRLITIGSVGGAASPLVGASEKMPGSLDDDLTPHPYARHERAKSRWLGLL
jgi:hypothetical protein